MPERETVERAREDAREGKIAFHPGGRVCARRDTPHPLKENHGAASTKQAIAIGLSKARPRWCENCQPKDRRQRKKKAEAGIREPRRAAANRRARVSRATSNALKREPRSAASRSSLVATSQE